MSFAQGSGPPASAKQLAYLLSLIRAAGHDGFRDARHPLGLTQRQAGGKFSMAEASALIEQLVDVGMVPERDQSRPSPTRPDPTAEVRSEREAERAAARLSHRQSEVVQGLPADLLAAELERRGWVVSPPD